MKHLNLSAGSQHEINEACVFVSSNPTSWQARISTTVNLSNSPAARMYHDQKNIADISIPFSEIFKKKMTAHKRHGKRFSKAIVVATHFHFKYVTSPNIMGVSKSASIAINITRVHC